MSDIRVDTPRKEEWWSTTVRFGGFEGLLARRGYGTASSAFTCFGHKWGLYLYPGGNRASEKGTVSVSVYLIHSSDRNIEVETIISVKDSEKRIVASHHMEKYGVFFGANGSTNFAQRSTILNALQERSLVVEV